MSILLKYMCENCLKMNKKQFEKILREDDNDIRIFFSYLTDEKLNTWYSSIATKNQVFYGYVPNKYYNVLTNNGCFYKHISNGYYIRIDLLNDKLKKIWIIKYMDQKYIQVKVYMQKIVNDNNNFNFQLEEMKKILNLYTSQFPNILNTYDKLIIELMAHRNLKHLRTI